MRPPGGASVAAILCAVLTSSTAFDPPTDIGHPAGLIPECPGVTKNATISPRMLQQLNVVVHRLSPSGKPFRRPLPIMSAARMLSKDKSMDFTRKKTVLYAVGFFDSSLFPQNQAIANAYCRRGYNVLITETFSFLTHIYPKSVRLTKVIGKKIGELLVKLTEQGLTAENIELAGLSLGAHIVGYAGKHFYAATGKKVSRITGLDPAGPCFRALPPHLRLDKSDAEQVDVIHTNIDGFGIAEPLGHVDFYANGGEFQPGDIPAFPCLIICSHIRAALYWWQAVEHPRKFVAVKCNSVQDARFAKCYDNPEVNYVGLETNFDRQGIFYLPTSNEFPYYRGKEGLKAENEIYTSVARSINLDDDFVV